MAAATLAHINIRTRLLEETLVFYEIALGFRRGFAPTNPDPALNVWLYDEAEQPSLHLNLRLPDEPAAVEGPSALDHIAFNCSDIEATKARLDRAGITYSYMPTRVPGLDQLVLHDPNGIKVELTFGHELIPPFRPCPAPAGHRHQEP